MDLIVRGGTVVTASGATRADIGVQDGTIVALGLDLSQDGQQIDASGAYVFPGGVDVHTHLSTARPGMGRPRADDFLHGTRGAAAGGVTTVCDFAFQAEGGSLREALDAAVADAQDKACIDHSFHVIVTDPSADAIAEVPALIERGFPTFKFFTPMPAFQSRGGDYMRFFRQVAASKSSLTQ
jgi:dihydropyrimidinase